AALRTNDGTGRLKTSEGRLLPFNVDGLPNLGGPDPSLFVAGDIRCNEQVGLISMHTLFMREHNRQALEIAAAQPELTGEQIFQRARARVGAIVQVITYKEFLPLLLGPDALGPYDGYDPEVNPSIANLFSAAAYRVGHTLLSPVLLRLQPDGQPIPEGHLQLADAFFAPWRLTDEGGIEPILRGFASSPAQEVDVMIIDDVRHFLFLAPDPTFLDLPAINMQRGRDHGLPSYAQARVELNLEPVETFADISSDPAVQSALATVYGSVDQIDPWIGALAEDHVDEAMVGELMQHVIGDQFRRLRDGDRFWYQNVFSDEELAELERTRLSDVIRRNTSIGDEIQDDAFLLPTRLCAPDIDGSGVVDVDDLVTVLLHWGVPGGPGDVDGSGLVDVDDLLEVLLGWGPCP
ncbi:MAG: peroxidase family protein, partial [Planctomycetota bacterium]